MGILFHRSNVHLEQYVTPSDMIESHTNFCRHVHHGPPLPRRRKVVEYHHWSWHVHNRICRYHSIYLFLCIDSSHILRTCQDRNLLRSLYVHQRYPCGSLLGS